MSIATAVEIVKSHKSSASIKTRALFYLRCLDTEEAALALKDCITNTSVLIDHEIAYILGQMKQEATIPFLFELADDENVNPIVRHEAIEALGNFEDKSLIPRIEKFVTNQVKIISESAVLAVKKLEQSDKKMDPFSKYHSRDPAYPFEGTFEEAVELFNGKDLEDKYRAMFYLRDQNTKEAVEVLASGFDDDSDLFKHELAYVFGQMVNPLSVDALAKVLDDSSQADIIRHEAAEALGNIGTDKAVQCLEKYLDTEVSIVQESACVGLGISNVDDDEYTDIDLLTK
ncbi:deoxyhypusine hydroxylase [Glugoides intestinalis]